MSYQIIISPDARGHIRELAAAERRVAVEAIEEQLSFQPALETRNRKPMRPNLLASWELRVDRLRIYYDIDEAEQTVEILAVGIKDRNQVRIGGQIYEEI